MNNRRWKYWAIGAAVIVTIPFLTALERRHLAKVSSSAIAAEYRQRLSRITMDDGVNSTEAAEIALIYLREQDRKSVV